MPGRGGSSRHSRVGEDLYARLRLQHLDRAESEVISPAPAVGSVFEQVEFWVAVGVEELGGAVFRNVVVVVVTVEWAQSGGLENAAGAGSVVGHGPEFEAQAAGAIRRVARDPAHADVSAAVVTGSEVGVTTALVSAAGVVGFTCPEGVSGGAVQRQAGGFGFWSGSDQGNKSDGGGDDFVGERFHGSGVVVGGLF